MASTEREAETAVSDECRFAVAGGRGSANGKVENVECCKWLNMNNCQVTSEPKSLELACSEVKVPIETSCVVVEYQMWQSISLCNWHTHFQELTVTQTSTPPPPTHPHHFSCVE